MCNFELHDLARELSDTQTSYRLARALIIAVESELGLLADNGCGKDVDFDKLLQSHLGNEESI